MKSVRGFVSRYWGILLLVVFWQAWVSTRQMNSIVLPSPIDVVLRLISDPLEFVQPAALTFLLATGGLALGMLAGSVVAVSAWAFRIAGGILLGISVILASVPVVALVPVLARIFGYDMRTVVAIVVVITFFPSFVFSYAGLHAVPSSSENLLKVLGANRWRRFWYLALPSAVPSWMVALRISAPLTVMAALVAEYLMGTSGLGHLFRASLDGLDMTGALASSVLATAIAVLGFSLALLAERKIAVRWQ